MLTLFGIMRFVFFCEELDRQVWVKCHCQLTGQSLVKLFPSKCEMQGSGMDLQTTSDLRSHYSREKMCDLIKGFSWWSFTYLDLFCWWSLTDSTMGFITILHHHMGNYIGSLFPSASSSLSQIQVVRMLPLWPKSCIVTMLTPWLFAQTTQDQILSSVSKIPRNSWNIPPRIPQKQRYERISET